MDRKSYPQLVAEAKADLILVQPSDVHKRIDAGEAFVLVDVREPNEWAAGVIPGATTIPRGTLEGAVDNQLPRDATVVLYCAGGGRSALAGRNLVEMGFSHVENLEGGFSAWAQGGFPVERR